MVRIWVITIVYVTQITRLGWGYKPTNITEGPHPVDDHDMFYPHQLSLRESQLRAEKRQEESPSQAKQSKGAANAPSQCGAFHQWGYPMIGLFHGKSH